MLTDLTQGEKNFGGTFTSFIWQRTKCLWHCNREGCSAISNNTICSIDHNGNAYTERYEIYKSNVFNSELRNKYSLHKWVTPVPNYLASQWRPNIDLSFGSQVSCRTNRTTHIFKTPQLNILCYNVFGSGLVSSGTGSICQF